MNNMSTQDTQEIEITPELAIIMQELSLPANSIAIGLRKGYEARVINDRLGPVAGNVIWAPGFQIDTYQRFLDSEVEGAINDTREALPVMQELEISAGCTYTQEDMDRALKSVATRKSIGEHCYGLRLSGSKWSDMGHPNALNYAKRYASTHNLPWPPNAPLPT